MYAEAIREVLSYTAGSAAASGIARLLEGDELDPTAGVVERSQQEQERTGRIGIAVSGLVALVLAMALFRRGR